MDQNELNSIMLASVQALTKQLTDDELISMNLCVQLGSNPKGKSWYEKASPLFTENNGTKMHDATKQMLFAVVMNKFG